MRYVRRFFRFWYDFVVGDDWRIAAGVAGVLAAGGIVVSTIEAPDALVAILVLLGIVAVVGTSVVRAR